MYIGDKNKIDQSNSIFADFINNGNLYVDKTAFIEHVLQDSSKVLLFTRPRRMGKSLNIDTLRTFLDFKSDSRALFKGLYIEKSEVFEQINTYPVVYLNLRDIDTNTLDSMLSSLRSKMLDIISEFFDAGSLSLAIDDYCRSGSTHLMILSTIIQEIYRSSGKKVYLLIDEYDKVTVDLVDKADKVKMSKSISQLLASVLKDHKGVEKAVMTGVTRLSKDSLLSDLNNVVVDDVFSSSVYDTDFSLTSDEVKELVTEEQFHVVKQWYNNMRVGDAELFNIYSVMCYLGKSIPQDYWALTGNAVILARLMNKDRLFNINNMLVNNVTIVTDIEKKLVIDIFNESKEFFCTDGMYYSLAVQSGYMTYSYDSDLKRFHITVPNYEAWYALSRLVVWQIYGEETSLLVSAFNKLPDTELCSKDLTGLISMQLSYHDLNKDYPEKIYHVFVLGLISGAGYNCKSNREAGTGRYDILIQSRSFNAIIEFKTSKEEKHLEKEVDTALAQIDEKEYYDEVKASKLLLYKIGIACCGKKCAVKTVLHQNTHDMSETQHIRGVEMPSSQIPDAPEF